MAAHAFRQDGQHLASELWVKLDQAPIPAWLAVEAEVALLFARYPHLVVAARVSEALPARAWPLKLRVLSELPA